MISLFALVIASMLLVAGCSPVETACPAIGYSSTLSIQLIGDSSQVSEIINALVAADAVLIVTQSKQASINGLTCVSVFVRFRPWDHTTSGSPGLG